ncbi:transcription elongation factor A protein 1 [Tripterygium wilfordii]|uniref:Transcription elongation factor A protein 1 n=1 Tax=Tripterygium wilfordii TaxID=458696 RepID=A0A7J7D5P5_TRIWF|nr:transcription elongation factor A protein 1 [Tripterygium wilfordii]
MGARVTKVYTRKQDKLQYPKQANASAAKSNHTRIRSLSLCFIKRTALTEMEIEFLGLIDVTRKAAVAASALNRVSPCGPEVFRCLDALKRLEDFLATPNLVETTLLPKMLFPLTKHPILKIRNAAVALIQKSKNRRCSDYQDSKQSKKIVRGNDDTRETKTVVRGSLVIRLKLPRKPTEPNPCNIDISGDKVREVVLDSLSKAVAEAGGESEIDPTVLATKIESMMFKAMGSFNGPNKLMYRSILFNLKDPKNPDLRRKVLRGKVTPEEVVSMTAEEMVSHQRRRENKQIRKNALSKKHIEVEDPEPQEMDF